MSEPITIAVVGLVGAILGSLLVAFIQPIWSNRLNPKSKLQATVRKYPFSIPNYLEKSISSYNSLRYSVQSRIRPNEDELDKLLGLKYLTDYLVVEILNNSNKQIDEISISVRGHNEFIADIEMEGSLSGTFFGKVCVIAKLKPKAKAMIRIWAKYLPDFEIFGPDESTLTITAREFDSVIIDYPPPKYLRRNYYFLPRILGFLIFFFFSVGVGIATVALINRYQ